MIDMCEWNNVCKRIGVFNLFKKILTILCFTIMISLTPVFADYQITVEATAYNAYEGEGINADGTECIPYNTIAVDPSVIPLGSSVYVPGFGWMVAHDTGGAIQGNIIDIAMNNNSEAINFGRQTLTITVAE